ncbi:EpsG-like putative glucosyltransferase [Nonlabens xylanidelens]|uniref:EpsG-like putative glucosyltransferase n=1 Tax=Nonlabens xylanidelens TaxID=191564 RepID=A0A2S6IGE5_9FLAO|nr:EpsG family protein [Nonlabens xylanidelens]PPK93266.1 EpsG-like putative glucosyltransferase [Nonlabens xylanidelens]PQJ20912.1 hypothetical protein BST94_05325 [Nonlabens xylanidelens]
MIFFILFAAIILLFSQHRSILFLFLFFVILFLLAGYRDVTVGTDTFRYLEHYQRIQNELNVWRLEYLWIKVMELVSFFNGTFANLLLVTHLIILIPLFFVFVKASRYPILSLFFYVTFYYYFYSLNIMRQSVAVSLILLAFYVFYSNFKLKWLYTVLIVTGAVLFHNSALIFILAIFMKYFLEKYEGYLITILVGSILLGLVFFNSFLNYLSLDKYEYVSNESEAFSISVVSILSSLVINVIVILIRNIIVKKTYWYYLFIASVVLSNLLIITPYGNRLVMFLGITKLILFANLIDNNNLIKKQRSLWMVSMVAYSLFYFILVLGNGGVLPYSSSFLNLYFS